MSVDRAGQVSLRAGSGSPCEFSDVTRSAVPDTKECATRETSKDRHARSLDSTTGTQWNSSIRPFVHSARSRVTLFHIHLFSQLSRKSAGGAVRKCRFFTLVPR